MGWDDTYTYLSKTSKTLKNMTPCHGSTHSGKLSSHQSAPNTENLFDQQQISETITPHYRNHPRAGSEKLSWEGPRCSLAYNKLQ